MWCGGERWGILFGEIILGKVHVTVWELGESLTIEFEREDCCKNQFFLVNLMRWCWKKIYILRNCVFFEIVRIGIRKKGRGLWNVGFILGSVRRRFDIFDFFPNISGIFDDFYFIWEGFIQLEVPLTTISEDFQISKATCPHCRISQVRKLIQSNKISCGDTKLCVKIFLTPPPPHPRRCSIKCN